jgi:hypothetical protein
MSIFATTGNIRARQTEADNTGANLAADDGSAGIIGRLTAFLPAEMITIWGVVLTLIDPGNDGLRWATLAAGVVVLLILLRIDLAQKDKDAKAKDEDAKPVSGSRQAKAFGVATVSFVVWALATPGTPLDGNQGKIAVAVAVVLTVIITKCAKLWDIEPNNPA